MIGGLGTDILYAEPIAGAGVMPARSGARFGAAMPAKPGDAFSERMTIPSFRFSGPPSLAQGKIINAALWLRMMATLCKR